MSSSRRTLLLFLFFHALYGLTSSGNVFRAPDEFEVYFQAEHFVDAGDISVPQTLTIMQPVIVNGRVVGSQSMFFGEVGRDGKPYAPYGPLAALLALPHHLAGRFVASIAGVPRVPLPDGIAWLVVVGGVTMLATATAGALVVAGFHRAALALQTPPREAWMLSLLLGGATVLWPYSTNFFSEAFQAAAFIWAAACLLEARAAGLTSTTGAPTRVLAAAALLTIAGLTKMTSLMFAPAFAIAALADRSAPWPARANTAIVLSIGVALAAAGHLIWNTSRFGNAFDFGYDWAETVPQLPARAFLLSDVPRGLAVLLLSPGKSLFIWAPALVLSLIGLRRFWNDEPAVALGVGVAAVAGLLFYAAYLFPEGGYAHGPRSLVPILPLMLLPACGVGAGRLPRPLVATCAIAGFSVALLATSVSYLDDQNMGGDLTAGGRSVYYERVAPPPGRAWNRYRLDYVPFVSTIASRGWLHAPTLGQGPDYFPLHLAQARAQAPNGSRIPGWLMLTLPAFWLTLLIGSALAAYKY